MSIRSLLPLPVSLLLGAVLLAGCGGSEAATDTLPVGARTGITCHFAKLLALEPGAVTTTDQTSVAPARTCGLGGGAWYEFTLPVPTVVYADTFGSEIDAVVGIVPSSCGSAPLACGDAACGTSKSQLVQTLGAGTYHLVVSGRGDGEHGPFVLHVEAARVPAAAAGPLPAGPFSLARAFTTFDGGTFCGSFAPMQWWWWASCPADAGTFDAAVDTTLSTFGTQVAFVEPAAASPVCSTSFTAPSVQATVAPGAGLHLLEVGEPSLAHITGARYVVTGHRP